MLITPLEIQPQLKRYFDKFRTYHHCNKSLNFDFLILPTVRNLDKVEHVLVDNVVE